MGRDGDTAHSYLVCLTSGETKADTTEGCSICDFYRYIIKLLTTMTRFISGSELPDAEAFSKLESRVPPISWDVELPGHLDQDRVVVDVGHLKRIQVIGGFSANQVFTFQGEPTQYDYSVAAINVDGTAIAGKRAVASKAEALRAVLDETGAQVEEQLDNYFKVVARHELNRTEMARQVAEKRQQPSVLRTHNDEEIWANVLDEHLQQSIRIAAKLHLLMRADSFWRGVVNGIIGSTISTMMLELALNEPTQLALSGELLAGFVSMNVGLDSLANKFNYGETFIKKRRWSLFEDMQPDRYVALNGLTRINSLIKYKK